MNETHNLKIYEFFFQCFIYFSSLTLKYSLKVHDKFSIESVITGEKSLSEKKIKF